MATVDPNGNSTTGITRTSTTVTAHGTNDSVKFNSSGGKDAWPAGDYLNIWVCNIGGGILGYAQFPGGPANTDGVVNGHQYFGNTGTATAPFNLGRTLTHEVGHYLNLRHIWGDGNCNADDFVSDTPTSDAPNYGCASTHQSCSSLDMVQNYMDYSDDASMNLYTSGQKTRMRALFDTGGPRASLLASAACGAPTPPTCTDGIQNGDETGVDCGGATCPSCPTGCTDNEATMSITLDNYPEETSWTVVDGNGNTLYSGGTYGNLPDGSTLTETFCLPDGCYDYNIFDTYGDGICCAYGNGSYSVTDASGNVLASGGSFGASETTNFCFGGGGGPTCTDGIQNGDETGVDCGGSICAPCSTPPTCTDGIQNGDETGVDCGGTTCAPCSTPPTCSDGIQNGNETGVDCGGTDCQPCSTGCTTQSIDDNNFDSGWGIWNDGGSDCRRSSQDSNYANSGSYCIRLRDNTNTSVMTTDNLNLAGFEEVTVDFTYVGRSMEDGEDFWLQVSTNGGSSYQTLTTYARGTDFSNNVREFETVVITGTFTSTTRFRFRNDASGNSDWVYIDDVVLTGCNNGTNRIIDEKLLEEKSTDGIESIHTYPNPTYDKLNVELNSSIESNVQVSMINSQGQLVNQKLINTTIGRSNITIDLSDYSPGIYFLHVISGEQKFVEKISVIR